MKEEVFKSNQLVLDVLLRKANEKYKEENFSLFLDYTIQNNKYRYSLFKKEYEKEKQITKYISFGQMKESLNKLVKEGSIDINYIIL